MWCVSQGAREECARCVPRTIRTPKCIERRGDGGRRVYRARESTTRLVARHDHARRRRPPVRAGDYSKKARELGHLALQRARAVPIVGPNCTTQQKMMQAAQCFKEEPWDKWSEVIRREPRRFMNVDETKVTTDLDFVLKTTTVVAPATGVQPRTSVPVTSRESFTFVYVINADGKVVLPSGAVIPRKTDITPRWFRDCQRQIDRSRVWVGAVPSGNFDSATFAEYMDVVLGGLRGPGGEFHAETDTYPLFVLLDQASVHMAISGADQKRTALGDVLVKHNTIAFHLPSGTTFPPTEL